LNVLNMTGRTHCLSHSLQVFAVRPAYPKGFAVRPAYRTGLK